MSSYSFENRVVVVTGAGNGLGRSHALEFARRGAKVVVNDLGGSGRGEGESKSVSDRVVEEIRDAGGTAIANADSVEHGDKIVQCALDSFGRVDVVVNNAGILRDSSFQKMTDEDWNLILRVHLTGSYSVTHAAWPYMRAQGYGRVLMTSSGAGIYGNFGQANYSAAKLGLHGLAQTLAIEGGPRGIQVNTIAPIAASRLTETVMPPAMLVGLRPDLVTPLAVYLCSENCSESGQIFEVGGGWVTRLRWEQSRGALFDAGTRFDVEALAARWQEVQSFEGAMHPDGIGNTLQIVGEHLGIDMEIAPQ